MNSGPVRSLLLDFFMRCVYNEGEFLLRGDFLFNFLLGIVEAGVIDTPSSGMPKPSNTITYTVENPNTGLAIIIIIGIILLVSFVSWVIWCTMKSNSDDTDSANDSSEHDTPSTDTPNDSMYCKYCGKKIDADSLFCKNCGKKL